MKDSVYYVFYYTVPFKELRTNSVILFSQLCKAAWVESQGSVGGESSSEIHLNGKLNPGLSGPTLLC